MWFNPEDKKKVSQVVTALNTGSAQDLDSLLCREKEIKLLECFLREKVCSQTGGFVYVSGTPGSGKTLTIQHVIRSLVNWAQKKKSGHIPIISINCMQCQDLKTIYSEVFDKVYSVMLRFSESIRLDEVRNKSNHTANNSRRKLFLLLTKITNDRRWNRSPSFSSLPIVLLVLDEIDELAKRRADILMDMFNLTLMYRSRFVLVGIANSYKVSGQSSSLLNQAIDQSFHVKFNTYSARQLTYLLCQRLYQLPGPVIDEQALDLLTKKISQSSGDMRRALDCCRNAVRLLVENYGEKSSDGNAIQKPGIKNKIVGIAEMHATLTTSEFWQTKKIEAIRGLPTTQSMILYSIAKKLYSLKRTETNDSSGKQNEAGLTIKTSRKLSVEKTQLCGKTSNPGETCSFYELLEAYTDFSREKNVAQLSRVEFRNACEALQSLGLLCFSTVPSCDMSTTKIAINIQQEDLLRAFTDHPFFL